LTGRVAACPRGHPHTATISTGIPSVEQWQPVRKYTG
jgi:hypothetical protein